MNKVTDTINTEWLITTDNMALDYENGLNNITDFSNDQLTYLIYFNWGYSGPSITHMTNAAENELAARGLAYNNELAEVINELAESYY